MNLSTSLVLLQPGMYIIRHAAEDLPPITLTRSPNSAGLLEFLSTRRSAGMLITDSADCVVAHIVDAPVELLVATYGDLPEAAAQGALRIDRIALGSPKVGAAKAKAVKLDKEEGLLLVGHIERQGDTIAKPEQMLGDPASNLRLEGFQVEWLGRPEGVDLAYGVSVEGHGVLPSVTSGNFCGTRNQARRITEVTLTLVGPRAGRFRLAGAACFSGGFRMPVTSGVPIGGPSGMEHLVALQLTAQPVKSKAGGKSIWDASPKTKVFGTTKTGNKKAAAPVAAKTQAPRAKKTASAAAKPPAPRTKKTATAASKRAAPVKKSSRK